MPADVAVSAFRTRGPAESLRRPWRPLRDRTGRKTDPRWWEQTILVPSWSKAPRLTTAVCRFHLGRRLAALRDDAVIVFTLPYYGRLASRFPGVPKVYFAFDPYQCYTGWNPDVVAAGERQLLRDCDATFAISPPLADDFRKLTDRPVFVQPNGVAESFLAAFDGPLPPPEDLPPGGPPVVGCVGQISGAYDWDMLDALVRLCPDLSFVFVGPVFGEAPEVNSRMERLFGTPNVRRLGPKPHAELPRYINRFDVCLNPLQVEPYNHRRSLLRLYDYLASDRPIVSTAIAPALEHRPHVEIGRDAAELAALLKRLVRRATVDRAARRAYIRTHTWERRAEQFLANLRSIRAVGTPG